MNTNTLELEQRSYRGNSNIKMSGVQTEWTPELIREYQKCMHNPVYFIETYMKVLSLDEGMVLFKMYDYQRNMIKHFDENRYSIVLSSRQSGKCADYSTKIDIRFKETKEMISISMGYLYKYIYTVNNQEKRYVSKEQIYKDLLEFDRKETEKCFEVLWRNTSYNSEKSWRNKREVKFSEVVTERTLYRTSSVDKNDNIKRSYLQNAICLYEYGNFTRVENKLSFVRNIAEELFRDFVRKNDGRKQSFLWKKAQKSSERNVEQKSYRRNEEDNIRIFKENVERKPHTEKSINGRTERNSPTSDVGILERPEEQRRTFKTNERSRIENRLYFHNRGESESYQEEKNLGKIEGARILRRTQKQNIKEFDWESFLRGYKRKDASKRIECSDANMSALPKNGQGRSNDKISLRKLSEEIERKYVGSFDVSGIEIWTNTGWKNLYSTSKTIPYRKYKIVFDNTTIQCADDHIFIDLSGNEIFAKDLKFGDRLNGGTVLNVIDEKIEQHMYDVCVEGELYYTNGILSHNSVTSVAYILWYALFNSDKTVAILANKGDTAREMLSRLMIALENVPFFLQPGCREYNKSTITFDNNTKIVARATSASSIRGMSISLVFLDEFAFVENAEEFYTSTYPVITSGKSTKIIITSTANGIGNPFYNIWLGAVNGTNEYKPFRVDWWDVPGRDEAWKKQTISNTSQRQFDQEFSNSFHSTGNTLISADKLLGLTTWDSEFEVQGVKIYKNPEQNREYVMAVDVAEGRGIDYSTFNIIDITQKPFRVVATFRDNLISPLLYPTIIERWAKQYNNAYVIVENNNQGSLVCSILYYDLEYENMFLSSTVAADGIGVRMDKKIKHIGCSNLKDLIEQGQLETHDKQTILELSTFVSKGKSFEAEQGCHDDLVMNLVLFAWFTNTPQFQESFDEELKMMLFREKMKAIEDEVMPFGHHYDAADEMTQRAQHDVIYQDFGVDIDSWRN